MTAPWSYSDPSRAPAQPNQTPKQDSDIAVTPGASSSDPSGSGPYAGGPSGDKKADAVWNRIRRRFFTQAGNGVAVPVTLAATTITITLPRVESNATYGVNVTPNWLTTSKVTLKTTTNFVVTFGTGAPASALIDYITFRSET